MSRVQKEVWETYAGKGGTSRPDLIVNAYMLDDVEAAETNVVHYFERNMQCAGNLALAARSAEIPLIQISTDHVFRGDHGPYSTSHHRHPINIFGLSMKFAEDTIRGFLPKNHLIVRISQVYGPEVGENPAAYVGRASYAFIGDVAFMIARNIISSPYSLRTENGIVHCGPIWFEEEADHEKVDHVSDGIIREGKHLRVRIGHSRGLIPSPGWVLPTSNRDDRTRKEKSSGFTAYWDSSVGVN